MRRPTALLLLALAVAPAHAHDPFRLDRPYAIDPTFDPGRPPGLSPERPLYAYNGGGGASGVALMVAGGVLFIGGLIVGDDIGTLLAVGGLGIGAYGTYLYFR